MDTRYAVVQGASVETVARYLPSNYQVEGVDDSGFIRISGTDHAGWTLDGYVIPRLASGLISAKEVV